MIKFLVPLDFLEQRLKDISMITSAQERNALMVDDGKSDSEVLEKLTNLTPINDLEAEAFLIKIRETSVQDQIEYIITCDMCNTMNSIKIETSDCIDLSPSYYNDQQFPVGLFTSLDSIINNGVLDEISIRDYQKLEDIMTTQNEQIVKKLHTKYCRKCKNEIEIFIDPRAIFTKSTLSSIYSDYVNISMYSNNGKLDIDSLYPFEREIYNSMISDKLKEGE